MEFIYLVLTCMPVRVTVGDSGLCCCTCVLSANELPCVLILHKHSGPRSVSDQLYNYIMAQTSGTAGHSGLVCDDKVGNKCRTS